MNQQNAFERIAELEAKLAIATANCEQAVKERDEARALYEDEESEHLLALRNLDTAMTKLEAMEPRLAAVEKERDELRSKLEDPHRERRIRWNNLVSRLRAEKGEEGKP